MRRIPTFLAATAVACTAPAALAQGPGIAIEGPKRLAVSDNAVRVVVVVPDDDVVDGQVTIIGKRKVWGKAPFKADRRRTVRVRLNELGRRALDGGSAKALVVAQRADGTFREKRVTLVP